MCLAIPGKIISMEQGDDLLRCGKVSFGGIVKDVYLGYVPEATVGDYVIVHAGFAISKLDQEEAQRSLEALETLMDLES